MNTQAERIIKVYRTLAIIPALVGARINKNTNTANSVWTQRNLERGKNVKFSKIHCLSSQFKKEGDLLPFDISNELLMSYSPLEIYKAVIKEFDNKEVRIFCLEIWSNSNLIHTIDLASLELHGEPCTDVEFGVLEWSPDETKLIYIAEKKEPKSEPFHKRKPATQDKSKDTEKTQGEQFLFKQDWGEQLVNKKQSVIILYDLTTDTFKVLEGLPEGLCPSQIKWSPDGSYVVGVALRTAPRKLGLIYCTNRPSAIFTLDFNGNYDEVTPEGKSAKCPRFSPDGKTLIWLQRDATGPHHSCHMLVKRDLPLNMANTKTVVDIVETEIPISEGHKFYGLYCSGFLKRCWASSRRLVLTTNQKNTFNTYIIDIDSGIIKELEYSLGSQVALDVHNDTILVNRRNYFVPDKLAIAHIPNKGKEHSIKFEDLTISEPLKFAGDYMFTYMDLQHDSTEVVDAFSAIYVGPKSGASKTIPLIIWPHGGPHSAFANGLALESSLFNSFGLAVLFINYRGSIGAGQASVNYLPGKIGQSDVADCMLGIEKALAQFPWLDSERLILVGGSHGGFLVTHLSGQYPDKFKVVVARNPVIDVASMSIISDIPDWCYVECGSSYIQVGQPTEEILVAMRKASPIQHAHKVKAPTLLQVGSKDQRVPPAQAIEYYHRLKANGKNVRMNMYEDNHPLGQVHNEMDNLINTMLWIMQHVTI